MNHLELTLLDFNRLIKKDKGKKVIDIGCRNDGLKQFFEEHGFVWVGIDREPETSNVIQGTFETLNSIEEAKNADIIFASHVLEHIENPFEALRQSLKCLNDYGLIFISLPCPCRHHILETDFDHINCFDEIQIEKALIYSGFTPITIFRQVEKYPDGEKYNIIAIGQKQGEILNLANKNIDDMVRK